MKIQESSKDIREWINSIPSIVVKIPT